MVPCSPGFICFHQRAFSQTFKPNMFFSLLHTSTYSFFLTIIFVCSLEIFHRFSLPLSFFFRSLTHFHSLLSLSPLSFSLSLSLSSLFSLSLPLSHLFFTFSLFIYPYDPSHLSNLRCIPAETFHALLLTFIHSSELFSHVIFIW